MEYARPHPTGLHRVIRRLVQLKNEDLVRPGLRTHGHGPTFPLAVLPPTPLHRNRHLFGIKAQELRLHSEICTTRNQRVTRQNGDGIRVFAGSPTPREQQEWGSMPDKRRVGDEEEHSCRGHARKRSGRSPQRWMVDLPPEMDLATTVGCRLDEFFGQGGRQATTARIAIFLGVDGADEGCLE